VSLSDLSPGDPDIIGLLREAGAEPPALTDTGTTQTNPYERAARIEAGQNPSATPRISSTDPLRSLGSYGYGGHDPSPYDNIPADTIYDSVIVCHATMSGGGKDMTVVAVFHPNENPRVVKKLVGERIANTILH